MSRAPDFKSREQLAQAAWLAANTPASARGAGGYDFCLHKDQAYLNLAPSIQQTAARYFKRPEGDITWHRFAAHARSSQACCVNFLMPLACASEALAVVVGAALGIAAPQMEEVEKGPDGEPWFVGFEWAGDGTDYLGEGSRGHITRGANATSADAIVRFTSEGVRHTLLIEWKYTETYGAPIAKASDPGAIKTRTDRYADLAFGVDGIVRPELGLRLADYFWDPFYQVLRQQLLAARMEANHEKGAQRVRVLHLSPRDNQALHAVTAPALRAYGTEAFAAYRATLRDGSAFIDTSIGKAFAPLLAAPSLRPAGWAEYLTGRYGFLIEELKD